MLFLNIHVTFKVWRQQMQPFEFNIFIVIKQQTKVNSWNLVRNNARHDCEYIYIYIYIDTHTEDAAEIPPTF